MRRRRLALATALLPAAAVAQTTRPTTAPASTRPDVGQSFPPFRMNRVADGKLVTNEALTGKPAVVVFGSWSSPGTRDQLPRIADLAARYGGRVNWLVVYTREMYPTTGPADGPERNRDDGIVVDADRTAAAKKLVATLKLKLDVAPDNVDDRLTRGADAFPNAAFVLDPQGRIAARFEWAEPFAIKRHLDRLLAPTR